MTTRIRRTPARLAFLALTTLTSLALTVPGRGFAQYSDRIGLSEVRSQIFENEDLIAFVPEANDRFAWALAAGDFNGDGADDLATGIPFDNGVAGSEIEDAGIVVIRYGAPGSGLEEGVAETVLFQGMVGSPSPPLAAEQFGAALVAGDFNGDLFDDLAVGAPHDNSLEAGTPRGAVFVYYGGPNGIEPPQGAEMLTSLLSEWEGFTMLASPGEFGVALAAGDFDGDGTDDLAIGAPRQWYDNGNTWIADAGAVFVAHGSANGLLPLRGYVVTQDSPGLHGTGEDNDRFGAAVAAGDFNADGYSDLAMGAPREDDSGAVNILFGSAFGLLFATDIYWLQWAAGLEPEAGDNFGFALAAGDLDGDGYADLAIGNPTEDLGAGNEVGDAGQVSVFYGSSALFDYARTRNISQGSVFNPGFDEVGDRFGRALAAGDFDDDGHSDLAIGHPLESALEFTELGAVTILMGAPAGGLGDRNRLLYSGFAGTPGSPQAGEQNGRSLAVGDFDGTGFADLAIGAPFHNDAAFGANSGDSKVMYGSLFADGFEYSTALRWSAIGP